MKKSFVLFFIFLLAVSSVFAVEKDDFDVVLKNDELNNDIALGYWYGLECIIQDACPSAYLIFDVEDNTLLGGYLAPSTRWDFCSNVTKSTKGAAATLPKEIAMGFCSMIGANETYAFLETYKKTEVFTLVMIDLSLDMEIIDTGIYMSRKQLIDSLTRHSMNYDEFMALMTEAGYTEDEILQNKDKDSLVIEALKLKNEKKLYSRPKITGIIVIIGSLVVFAVIILAAVIISQMLKNNPRFEYGNAPKESISDNNIDKENSLNESNKN